MTGVDPEVRSRPLAFVDDLEAPELRDGDRAHLERSLRIRQGSEITVADGSGRYRSVRFGPELEPVGSIAEEPRPQPSLTVGFALVKGDRSDLVVQKLTELGVDAIVPIHTERSVVRWDDRRAAKNHDRHRRIVREAAMQSRNLWPPTVEPRQSLARFLGDRPEAVLADPSGPQPIGSGHHAVAIGPEGGFTPTELELRDAVSLPGRILRTETAAITTGVLLASSRLGRDRQ